MNRDRSQASPDPEGLEGRFAVHVAAALNEQLAKVPYHVSERLRVAREQAVDRARSGRRVAAAAALAPTIHADGTLGLSGPASWWLRLASWAPLVVLVAGLVLIHEDINREQVLAAAEIDAVLLADDLPPDAWSDPGFREYLKSVNR